MWSRLASFVPDHGSQARFASSAVSRSDAGLHRLNLVRRQPVIRPAMQQTLFALGVTKQEIDELLRALVPEVEKVDCDTELEEVLSNQTVVAQQRGCLAVVDVREGGEHEPFLGLHVAQQLVVE